MSLTKRYLIPSTGEYSCFPFLNFLFSDRPFGLYTPLYPTIQYRHDILHPYPHGTSLNGHISSLRLESHGRRTVPPIPAS